MVLWACSNIEKAAKALVASEPMATWQKFFVRSFCHVTPSLLSSTVFCQCRNITPPFSKACPQALYVHIIPVGHSCLCAFLVACRLHCTSIPSIRLDTLAV